MGELGISGGDSITVATGTDDAASYITVSNTGPSGRNRRWCTTITQVPIGGS